MESFLAGDECDFVAGKRDQLNHHKAMVHRQADNSDKFRADSQSVPPFAWLATSGLKTSQ